MKTMKTMKSKLMASIAMLTLSAVMLTSVSFAWFTISTAPEITMMTASVTTNDNLEIVFAEYWDTESTAAVISVDNTAIGSSEVPEDASDTGAEGDTGNNLKWGNQIDLTGAFNDVELKPAVLMDSNTVTTALADYILQAPVYGFDGRVDELVTLTEVAAIVNNDTTTTTTDDDNGFITEYIYTVDGEQVSYGFSVDYYLRTNVDGAVVGLETTATDRGMNEDATGSTGSGSYIDLSAVPESLWDDIRIDIIVDTTADTTNGAVTVYTAVLVTTDIQSTNIALELVYAYDDDDTSSAAAYKAGDDATLFTATSANDLLNEAIPVTLVVYLDGETITNADATEYDYTEAITSESIGLNLQFSMVDSSADAITGAMDAEVKTTTTTKTP